MTIPTSVFYLPFRLTEGPIAITVSRAVMICIICITCLTIVQKCNQCETSQIVKLNAKFMCANRGRENRRGQRGEGCEKWFAYRELSTEKMEQDGEDVITKRSSKGSWGGL